MSEHFCQLCGRDDREAASDCPECGQRTVAWDTVVVDPETLPLFPEKAAVDLSGEEQA